MATATRTQGTWTKLRSGEWGVRVSGRIAEGDQVEVARKDGTTSVETVRRVLWSGRNRDGREVSLVSVRESSRTGRGPHTCTDRCYGSHPCRQCGRRDAYAVDGQWGCFRYDEEV
jgi:hypothetical protein